MSHPVRSRVTGKYQSVGVEQFPVLLKIVKLSVFRQSMTESVVSIRSETWLRLMDNAKCTIPWFWGLCKFWILARVYAFGFPTLSSTLYHISSVGGLGKYQAVPCLARDFQCSLSSGGESPHQISVSKRRLAWEKYTMLIKLSVFGQSRSQSGFCLPT